MGDPLKWNFLEQPYSSVKMLKKECRWLQISITSEWIKVKIGIANTNKKPPGVNQANQFMVPDTSHAKYKQVKQKGWKFSQICIKPFLKQAYHIKVEQ